MTRNIVFQKRLEALCKISIYFVLILSFTMLVCITYFPSLLQIICWHTTPITVISALAYLLTSISYVFATAKNGKAIKLIIARVLALIIIGIGTTVLSLQISGRSVPFLAQIVHKNLQLTLSLIHI